MTTTPPILRLTVVTALLVLALPSVALAGCEKDTDCKGDRICNEEKCVEPGPNSTATNATADRSPGKISESDRIDYSRRLKSGLNTQISAAALTFSFGLASAIGAIADSYAVSLGSGAAALLSASIMIPIGTGPASSTRRLLRSTGQRLPPPGFSITGWVLYGLAVANGTVLVVYGVEEDVNPGLIISTSLLGATSAIFMALDTAKLSKQLRDSGGRASRAAQRPKVRVAIAPVITPELKQLALVGIF